LASTPAAENESNNTTEISEAVTGDKVEFYLEECSSDSSDQQWIRQLSDNQVHLGSQTHARDLCPPVTHTTKSQQHHWLLVSRPTRHKIGHFRDVLKKISWAGVEKQKPNTTKAYTRHQKK